MNRDVVESLLSCILRSRDAALQAGADLDADALSGAPRAIYDLSMEALDSGIRPDFETVRTHLRARDQWTEATERWMDAARERQVAPMNVGTFIEEINESHLEDEVLNACEDLARRVDDGDLEGEGALDFIESRLFQIGSGQQSGFRDMGEVVSSLQDDIQEAYETEGGIIGIPSGLEKLDNITGGFQDGKLYLVAARPGMGKSALAGTCIFNAAEDGYHQVGNLLEMDAESFANRRAAKRAQVNSFDLKTGQVSETEMKRFRRASESMRELPIWINDTPALTVEQVYRKARRLKIKHDADILWLDYLQLLEESGGGERRERAVSHMTRMLKLTAKELDIPVVALSQLNRAVEHRNPPKPQLADLRDSGSIEQDADVVTFIYRPEEYGIEVDEQGNSTIGIAKLLVEKHRGGPTGAAVVQWNDKYASFENLARRQ